MEIGEISLSSYPTLHNNPPSGNIRKILPKDFPWIVQIENKCFGDTLSYSPRQLKYLLTKAKSSCFIETLNETIRGFIIILYRKRSASAAIETLNVDPCFQGNGIGMRLLKAAEEDMIASGIKWMRLEVSINNLPALRLYEKAGFKITAFLPSFYFNPHSGTLHAYRMIKKLT